MIGPITARTVAQAMEAAPDHLVDAYGIARRSTTTGSPTSGRPAASSRGRGTAARAAGSLRAEEFISERFHFTRAEHDRRVAAWG